MNIYIRQELNKDYIITEELTEKAFKGMEFSNNNEALLVRRLRKSKYFIPELSLVAEMDDEIVGHILLSKIKINNDNNSIESLALAPISVLPEYQNKGVGKTLIKDVLNRAKELGYKSVIVVGHEKYYPKFGFRPMKNWKIRAAFDVPENVLMGLELEKDAFSECENGIIEYPKVFFE
ncbi:GNAT family N-acetyltransferase [Anaeromicrobium sediminis]|uniref:GNAT family N-acetyltransferase n=1 Tax=Anaeromicrobium sediminis TaxID=1478221 RepID=A0A267M8N2_9FIRM|nr:N-acetyltransferase [Anaeromicrobium sediminis]PAB55919.1 GNAT family N-acetyltransferase [Anaeromicrobium sediminis]